MDVALGAKVETQRVNPFFLSYIFPSEFIFCGGDFFVAEEAFLEFEGGEWTCSICRYRAPELGKRPRWFSYEELEEATESFSDANFVAEGGFGWVHRGILSDGSVVAVKTLKSLGGKTSEDEFRAEMEVLSRAQHRNVVLLLGFCVEGPRRILVYDYVCNGSLAIHLHGRN